MRANSQLYDLTDLDQWSAKFSKIFIYSMLSRFTDPDLLKNMESEENFRFLNLSSALAALHGLVADNCILARRQFVFGQICTIYVSADLHAVSLHVQNHRTISTQRYIMIIYDIYMHNMLSVKNISMCSINLCAAHELS